jgi:DnaJ-class molecular chaperone
MKKCTYCNGTGKRMCSHCNGRGYIKEPNFALFALNPGLPYASPIRTICFYCNGTGEEKCPHCDGTGKTA